MRTPNPAARTPLVLVVDDYADVREMYADYLKFEGFRVATAATGPEALVAARVERPELILMDVTMPGMDGFTATERIKEDPALASVPVLILTAHVFAEYEEKAKRAGCNGFIRKPCLPDELARAVRAAIRRER
jgi:two-component system, cell cycle response regulator DivK